MSLLYFVPDMSEPELKLAKPPIVEAVVDIDCDMPPGFQLAALEKSAQEAFSAAYPKYRVLFVEQHRIEAKGTESSVHSTNRAVQALQFLHDDEKQLVQVRAQGFSFNRLAPYTTLDDYLQEIERSWRAYVRLAVPVQVRAVKLRYINRIDLPAVVELNDYLQIGPRLPDEEGLAFLGFLNQYIAVEKATGHEVHCVLTIQPTEQDKRPLIFDNGAGAAGPVEPENWTWILEKIQLLRGLKNRVFKNTLTERCLNLFQQ